jgi:hypothetical protein
MYLLLQHDHACMHLLLQHDISVVAARCICCCSSMYLLLQHDISVVAARSRMYAFVVAARYICCCSTITHVCICCCSTIYLLLQHGHACMHLLLKHGHVYIYLIRSSRICKAWLIMLSWQIRTCLQKIGPTKPINICFRQEMDVLQVAATHNITLYMCVL